MKPILTSYSWCSLLSVSLTSFFILTTLRDLLYHHEIMKPYARMEGGEIFSYLYVNCVHYMSINMQLYFVPQSMIMNKELFWAYWFVRILPVNLYLYITFSAQIKGTSLQKYVIYWLGWLGLKTMTRMCYLKHVNIFVFLMKFIIHSIPRTIFFVFAKQRRKYQKWNWVYQHHHGQMCNSSTCRMIVESLKNALKECILKSYTLV